MESVEKDSVWREVDLLGNESGRSVKVVDEDGTYVIVENVRTRARCRMRVDSLLARFRKVTHVATLGPEVGADSLEGKGQGHRRVRPSRPRPPHGPR